MLNSEEEENVSPKIRRANNLQDKAFDQSIKDAKGEQVFEEIDDR